jgi:hypothetical protein
MAWRPRDIESFLKVKTAWPEIIYIKKRTKSTSKKKSKK